MNLSSCVILQPCNIPNGAIGVWQIPELDISIPVYTKGKKVRADYYR